MIDLDEDEKAHLEANIAWLESANPDDWHRVALEFNWGEPLYVLDWIVRQPNCDLATALDIFWKGEPECWQCEADAFNEEPNGFSYLNAKICAYVADRVRSGGYVRSEIAYKPDAFRKAYYGGLVRSEEGLETPFIRSCPDLMLDREGRNVDLTDDFYRRYPEQFHLSAFSEEFSQMIEDGVFETPRSINIRRKVEEVERATLRALPDWLKPELSAEQLKQVQSDAATFVLNSLCIGMILAAMLAGGLSRFGPTLGWALGCGLILIMSTTLFTSFRSMDRTLGASGLILSKHWLGGASTLSFTAGAGLSLMVFGRIGVLRESIGAIPLIAIGLGIALPAFYYLSKLVAERTLTREALG